MSAPRREGGMVLAIVLVFVLLLVSSIATFLRRATIDRFAARNRDAAARAEALARGGVRLAEALLLEDRIEEQASAEGGFRVESRSFDVWGDRLRGRDLEEAEDAELYLEIEDAGARLNLNALFVDEEPNGSSEGAGAQEAPDGSSEADPELFLREVLAKVIDEMPGRPEEKLYDVEELVLNLVDWVDADEIRRRGGAEDEWYQGRTPPYTAANGPLLSVDELRLVQGFDAALVDALRPYVGVFPLAAKEKGAGLGVNPNTAESWVLHLLWHGDALARELAKPDEVQSILKEREENVLCEAGVDETPGQDEQARPDCLGLLEAADVDPSTIFPQPSWTSDVFRVEARATVGEIERTLEVVLDRSKAPEVKRLAWRMR